MQGILCAIGFHSYERLGTRTDVGHRYSEVHETLYEVHRERYLMRCEHCAAERIVRGRYKEIEVGHYERVFVKVE